MRTTDSENPRARVINFPEPTERSPTILVVDDEVLIRMMISDFLQECGFKVLEAGSASEAVEMIASQSTIIDLVFSDIRLPGAMNGFALAKWLRENYPGMAVMLCSGDAKKADAALELCADEPFFAKPYDLNLVVAQIRQMINKRSSSAGS